MKKQDHLASKDFQRSRPHDGSIRAASPAARSAGVARLRGDLVRAQPRRVIEDLRGDHQLVGAGARDEGLQLPRAPSRASRSPSTTAPGRACSLLRRRQMRLVVLAPAAAACDGRPRAQVDERLLHRAWRGSAPRSSVSAANTLKPSITYGCSQLLPTAGSARGRSRSPASSCAGAKCEAKANGRPSAAASCAPNRLEPRIQIGTSSPAPGTARTCCPGSRASK